MIVEMRTCNTKPGKCFEFLEDIPLKIYTGAGRIFAPESPAPNTGKYEVVVVEAADSLVHW